MSTSTKDRARADLSAAADLIEQHGWLNRGGGSCNTGFCLSDAIVHVVNADRKRYGRAIGLLAASLLGDEDVWPIARIARSPRSVVIRTNDWTIKSKSEAVQRLRQATEKD